MIEIAQWLEQCPSKTSGFNSQKRMIIFISHFLLWVVNIVLKYYIFYEIMSNLKELILFKYIVRYIWIVAYFATGHLYINKWKVKTTASKMLWTIQFIAQIRRDSRLEISTVKNLQIVEIHFPISDVVIVLIEKISEPPKDSSIATFKKINSIIRYIRFIK